MVALWNFFYTMLTTISQVWDVLTNPLSDYYAIAPQWIQTILDLFPTALMNVPPLFLMVGVGALVVGIIRAIA